MSLAETVLVFRSKHPEVERIGRTPANGRNRLFHWYSDEPIVRAFFFTQQFTLLYKNTLICRHSRQVSSGLVLDSRFVSLGILRYTSSDTLRYPSAPVLYRLPDSERG
jgi:hypothetical protein